MLLDNLEAKLPEAPTTETSSPDSAVNIKSYSKRCPIQRMQTQQYPVYDLHSLIGIKEHDVAHNYSTNCVDNDSNTMTQHAETQRDEGKLSILKPVRVTVDLS